MPSKLQDALSSSQGDEAKGNASRSSPARTTNGPERGRPSPRRKAPNIHSTQASQEAHPKELTLQPQPVGDQEPLGTTRGIRDEPSTRAQRRSAGHSSRHLRHASSGPIASSTIQEIEKELKSIPQADTYGKNCVDTVAHTSVNTNPSRGNSRQRASGKTSPPLHRTTQACLVGGLQRFQGGYFNSPSVHVGACGHMLRKPFRTPARSH